MSTILSEPQTPDAGGLTPTPPQFALPGMGNAQLPTNPQLPQHPLGAYTDSMYEAQIAQLRQQIAKQYNDVLQQLGYTNAEGQFVPGQVEIEANKQRSILGRNLQLADEGVTQQAQQQGTLFSGLRGTQQARAEFPFQSALSDLEVSVPKQLTDLYGQGTDLLSQFNTQQNLYLAEAAQRQAANIAANSTFNPAAPSGGPGPDPGGAAPPPEWTNPVTQLGTDNPYGAAPAIGGGNLYGTLDPALAGSMINHSLPPAPVAPALKPKPKTPSSNNSPYYYGGGGYKPGR